MTADIRSMAAGLPLLAPSIFLGLACFVLAATGCQRPDRAGAGDTDSGATDSGATDSGLTDGAVTGEATGGETGRSTGEDPDGGGTGESTGSGGIRCDFPTASCGGLQTCSIDLLNNSEHCGSCGRDCFGGGCLSGECQRVELEPDYGSTVDEVAHTTDGSIALLYASGSLRRYDPDANTTTEVAAFDESIVQTDGVSLSDELAVVHSSYPGGPTDVVLIRRLEQPGEAVITAAEYTQTTQPHGIRAVGNRVYWLEDVGAGTDLVQLETTDVTCDDSCDSSFSFCDDGGPGADGFDFCAFGTHCSVCGPRLEASSRSVLANWPNRVEGLLAYAGAFYVATSDAVLERVDIETGTSSVVYRGEHPVFVVAGSKGSTLVFSQPSDDTLLVLDAETLDTVVLSVPHAAFPWNDMAIGEEHIYMVGGSGDFWRVPLDGSNAAVAIIDLPLEPSGSTRALRADGLSVFFWDDHRLWQLAQ